MWARVIEVMLGCWLAVSPFIFVHSPDQGIFWWNDLSCASVVILLALLSFWQPMRRAHLAIVVVALWLILFGYLAAPNPAPPALQNNILIGLLLLMLAIIPCDANLPPQAQRDSKFQIDLGKGGQHPDFRRNP